MTILIVTIVVLFILSILWYGRYYETHQLEVKEVDVSDTLGFKLLHLSDIHYGRGFSHKQLRHVVNVINEMEKDLVVFSGDLFANTFEGDLEPLIKELSRINSTHKYAVWGNHDYKKYAVKSFPIVMQKSGFKVLKDENDFIKLKGKKINIVGTDDFRDGTPDVEYIHTLNKDKNYDYSILIVHEPDLADEFVEDKFNLILSGHTHGGQVRLPGDIRGTTRGGRNYIDGLYHLDHNTKLYVSSGLGSAVFRFRFRVKPSISSLNI